MSLVRDIVSRLSDKSHLVTVVDARSEEAEAVRAKISHPSPQGTGQEAGVDGVLILPENQAAFDFGMALLKNHGTCVVVSFPEGGFQVSGRDLIFRDIKVFGCLVGTVTQLKTLLNFAAKHDVRAITKLYALETLNKLVEDYNAGIGGKLVVDMTMGLDTRQPSNRKDIRLSIVLSGVALPSYCRLSTLSLHWLLQEQTGIRCHNTPKSTRK